MYCTVQVQYNRSMYTPHGALTIVSVGQQQCEPKKDFLYTQVASSTSSIAPYIYLRSFMEPAPSKPAAMCPQTVLKKSPNNHHRQKTALLPQILADVRGPYWCCTARCWSEPWPRPSLQRRHLSKCDGSTLNTVYGCCRLGPTERVDEVFGFEGGQLLLVTGRVGRYVRHAHNRGRR